MIYTRRAWRGGPKKPSKRQTRYALELLATNQNQIERIGNYIGRQDATGNEKHQAEVLPVREPGRHGSG